MNKVVLLSIFMLVSGVFILSCRKDPTGKLVQYNSAPYQPQYVNNTLSTPSFPADNPLTVAKVRLGRMLFYNKNLSSDGTMSCASCHNQQNAFSDINRFSIGVDGQTGDRQAMPIFNMAWHTNGFFWDGRAHLLRDQSLEPIENPIEMNETLDHVIEKLYIDQEIKNQFIRAFGSIEITEEKMSLALENFMMSIVSDDSRYDRYLEGLVQLTPSEERGRVLFFSDYNGLLPNISGGDCYHCHAGSNFEDDLYFNNGLDYNQEFTDFGRELVTGLASDRAKFKVPSLRNIEVTAPYMHDGRFETLEDVIDHYNSDIKNSSTVEPNLQATSITGLMLDEQDKEDLINFLKTLTDYTFLNNTSYSDPY